jgi:DNA (cytosine-5)-methyltransferase 1
MREFRTITPTTGRVHPRYTIAGSPPGRSSCAEPNIQGAPRDPRIRGVFRAADGYVLVAADYNCMELRAAAYFFDDPQLAAVFERGDDPHKLTASRVAGRPIEDISDDERSKAKAVNFGTIYGIGAAGLVAQIWKNFHLVVSLADAENLIAGFVSLYPVMIEHRRDYAAVCQRRGAIVIGNEWREGKGRIVPLDRLPKDQSTMTCAYSYPIQGICADICMKALTEVDRRLLADKIDGRLVGWIHDELIVETREADVDRVKALLQSEMERAFLDTFPEATTKKLIEVKVALNWAAIKEKEKKAPADPPILKEGPLRALDLFAGAGGASRGLQLAGFHVTGIDIEAQPHYIGDAFIQGDALKLEPAFLEGFDLIWASPPCQAHSSLKVLHNAHKHPDLVAATRELLRASGRPYVIENVVGAPLIDPILLCGTMFDLQTTCGAQLRRHRLFEASFPIAAPACQHDETRPTIGIYGGHFRDRRRPRGKNHQSGSNFSVDDGRAAMRTPWMTVDEISQAIPPAYVEYIARQFLRVGSNLHAYKEPLAPAIEIQDVQAIDPTPAPADLFGSDASPPSDGAAIRHQAAMTRREANAIRRQRAEEKRKGRALKHGFHLSAYEREDADFYPTPAILAAGLAVGLPQLRLEPPKIALDPCGGDGALRRGLGPSGIDVRLTDLYPEQHPAADGYLTRELLDAGHAESLRFSLEQAGPNCSAIITNSPHNTEEATAIARNLVALVEEKRIDFAAMLFKTIWGDEKGRLSLFNRPSFLGEISCCWRVRWILESKGSPIHAYAWYVWRKEPRSGLSLKVRVSEAEAIAATNAAISREAA